MKKNIDYEQNQEPIILSKPLLDICLQQKNPSDVIALYTFYYYTAKWQETNQPKVTTLYAAKGLKWGHNRIRKIKKILIELGLIGDVQIRDQKNNKIIGHFIKVYFIWNQSFFKKNKKATQLNSQGVALREDKATLPRIPRVDIREANALSTNNKTKNKKITKKYFNKFWLLYPKHTDKGKALTAWNKLSNKKVEDKPSWKVIKKAIKDQKKTKRWKDKYIPLPTTWINGSRWLDDPAEMDSSNWNDFSVNGKKQTGFVGKNEIKYKKSEKV